MSSVTKRDTILSAPPRRTIRSSHPGLAISFFLCWLCLLTWSSICRCSSPIFRQSAEDGRDCCCLCNGASHSGRCTTPFHHTMVYRCTRGTGTLYHGSSLFLALKIRNGVDYMCSVIVISDWELNYQMSTIWGRLL